MNGGANQKSIDAVLVPSHATLIMKRSNTAPPSISGSLVGWAHLCCSGIECTVIMEATVQCCNIGSKPYDIINAMTHVRTTLCVNRR
jgi:hypothetical protein